MKQWKAILFDLDGTLVDTFTDIKNAQLYALSKLNVVVENSEKLLALKGVSLPGVLSYFLKCDISELSMDLIESFRSAYREHYSKNMFVNSRLYPAVEETLLKLSEFPKAVSTTKPMEYAIPIIKYFCIQRHFLHIVGCDNLKPKPAPDVFLESLRRLNINPGEDVLIIGDTDLDIHAGKDAGCSTCRFLSDPNDDNINETADFSIKSFEDIIEIV